MNYMVTGSDDDTERLVRVSRACTQIQKPVSSAPQESVQLEVWTTKAARPEQQRPASSPASSHMERPAHPSCLGFF